MDALKAVFKFMIASTLIVSGVLLGGTLFATKRLIFSVTSFRMKFMVQSQIKNLEFNKMFIQYPLLK